jgi:uncharacterized protein
MKLEWDYLKAASNIKKHNIDYADAATVLYDDSAIAIRSVASEEDRFVTPGIDSLGRILVIVYTWRQDSIRPISARRATPRERRRYER